MVPLTGHVDRKTREKIRKGEFVNLSKLAGEAKGKKSRKRYEINDGLFEEIEEDSSLSSSAWIEAYIIFMSIRLDSYPRETQGMLRHMQIVREMYRQGQNGVVYDTKFREMKAQYPDMQWGELLPIAVPRIYEGRATQKDTALPLERRGPGGEGESNKERQPGGTCVFFNRGQRCPRVNCRYEHACVRCGSVNHPVVQCKN